METDDLIDLVDNNSGKQQNRIFYTLIIIAIILFITGIVIIVIDSVDIPNSNQISVDLNKTVEKTNTKVIYVDISGAVNYPGVYKFEEEKRIADLVEKAEGFRSEADLEWIQKNLNLAEILKDEAKIYIPFIGENGALITNNISNKVNLNKASIEELIALPDIGEVSAKKIVEYRNKKTIQSFEELKNVDGIGDKTIEKIKDLVSF